MGQQAQQLEARRRFTRAVNAGRVGNYGPAVSLVESMREKHGDTAADAQRCELWRAMRRGEPQK